MTLAELDAALVAGIPAVFGDRMNLAYDAVLRFAAECEPDRWPTVPTILRFAECYGVCARELAALCGIVSHRLSPRGRVVWCDAYRFPEVVRRTSPETLPRRVLSAYGCYVAAATLAARDRASLH